MARITEITDKQIIDDTGTYKYAGVAEQGTATSEPKWYITRISSANPQVIDHAPVNSVWDNRTSLSYS